MSKQRNRRVSRKPIYLVLVFSLLVAICFGLYKTYFSPTPINIMAITPAPLTYGNTTISGGLHKDLAGNFVLVLPDRRTVSLDVKGVDQLDGLPVTITGVLNPNPLSMVVQKIIVSE